MPNPPFNETLTGSLTGVPPFTFDGVTMNLFPLRANLRTLTAFCNSYLNDAIPPEVGVFKPSLPYVQLGFINYGRMSPERGNLGWVSQNEVVFAIPLDWYRMVDGELVFWDWASLSPFIFVDDESSQLTGREVFGWPKVQGWLSRGDFQWQPGGHKTVVELSTRVFSKLYAGHRPEPRVLLEIGEWMPPRWSRLPPDPSWLDPNALRSWMTVGLDLWDTWTRLPQRGYDAPLERRTLAEKLRRLPGPAEILSRNPTFNTINLKQFRDAEDPELVCYQALTNGCMKPARYGAFGLLGDANVAMGDLSGGYTVRLHRYPSQPIDSLLGLDAVAEIEGQEGSSVLLKPVLPYWVELDIRYGVAETLCWRTRESAWHLPEIPLEAGSGPEAGTVRVADSPASGATKATASRQAEPPCEAPPPRTARQNRYNTTRGGALTSVTGPFEFENVVIRVLPLLADEEKLRALLERYLGDDAAEVGRLEPWGRYVYMTANSFGPMASKTADIGWWAHRAVWFLVPVKWYDPQGRLITVATVPVFVYQDSDFATSIGREVNGWPAVLASITSPPYVWMQSPEEIQWPQDMLELETEMLPSLGTGQQSDTAKLLTITEADVLAPWDERGWRDVDPRWADTLVQDHRKKVRAKRDRKTFLEARALALEVLAQRRPVLHLALKQFRDGERPAEACYQALVESGMVFERIDEIYEIPARLHVRIRRSPSQPIVDLLGLAVKTTEVLSAEYSESDGEGGVIDVVQAIRPFWINADLKTVPGKNLCWRAGSTEWQGCPSFDDYLLHRSEHTDVGVELVRRFDSNDEARLRLQQSTRNWLRAQHAGDGSGLLASESAVAALEAVQPQEVIEALLSHEWANRSSPVRRRGWEQKSDFAIDLKSLGPEAARKVFPAEATLDERWYPRRVTLYHDPESERSRRGLAQLEQQLREHPDLDLEIVETRLRRLAEYDVHVLIEALEGALELVLTEEGLAVVFPDGTDRLLLEARMERARESVLELVLHPHWLRAPILMAFGRVELGGDDTRWEILDQVDVDAANLV